VFSTESFTGANTEKCFTTAPHHSSRETSADAPQLISSKELNADKRLAIISFSRFQVRNERLLIMYRANVETLSLKISTHPMKS